MRGSAGVPRAPALRILCALPRHSVLNTEVHWIPWCRGPVVESAVEASASCQVQSPSRGHSPTGLSSGAERPLDPKLQDVKPAALPLASSGAGEAQARRWGRGGRQLATDGCSSLLPPSRCCSHPRRPRQSHSLSTMSASPSGGQRSVCSPCCDRELQVRGRTAAVREHGLREALTGSATNPIQCKCDYTQCAGGRPAVVRVP